MKDKEVGDIFPWLDEGLFRVEGVFNSVAEAMKDWDGQVYIDRSGVYRISKCG